MNILQSAGLTCLFIILSFVVYNKVSQQGYENSMRWMLKIFIVFTALLLFLNINLLSSTMIQIKTTKVMEKYMVPATMELIGTVHNPANTVKMEENRIYINKDTENEKVYYLMRTPFFGVIDQSQSNELAKELGEIK